MFKGLVTFHGGLQTPPGQNYADVKGALLILHGTADTLIKMDQFTALGIELEKADVTHEMIAYGGAPHGFSVFGSDHYRKDADRKSWECFSRFLADSSKVAMSWQKRNCRFAREA